MACQRFTVNVSSLCLFRWENRHRYFCGPTNPWEGIGKGFWRGGTKSLMIFSKPSAINEFYVFTNYRLCWANHAISLSMMSYRGLMLDLKANIFLYP